MSASVPDKCLPHWSICLQCCREKKKISSSPLKRLPPAPVSNLHSRCQRSTKEGPLHLILKVHRNFGHSSHSVLLMWEKWMLRDVSVYSQKERTWCLLRLNFKQANVCLEEKRQEDKRKGNEHFFETSILGPQKPIWSEDENLPVLETNSWVLLYLIFQSLLKLK